MADYDFSRFSTQSFETFIQAMSAAVAGPNTVIFGAGPDGAREATVEGSIKVGEAAWSGYTVFQAKHRQYPEGSPKDATWLISQIDEEFAKFADKRRALRRPDYYVMASNVRLSAAAANSAGKGGGGIDKVMRHLKAAANKIGIKDVALWHADTLGALLDVHEGVRSKYDFFVQPGDVLARILRNLEGPGQDEILIPYLCRSLRHAREIKNRDIGQAANRTVMLEDVFVDLPVDQEAQAFTIGTIKMEARVTIDHVVSADEMPFISAHYILAEHNAVAELMRRGAEKFEPQRSSGESGRARWRLKQPNRVVLLGGPGQGKSTAGQFLAQLCRARLLEPLQESQTPETNQTVEAVLQCARDQKIPLIGQLRYPFHIELPRYADALSKAERADRGLSILAHIANDINHRGEHDLKVPTLQKWLGVLPTVIILDGLDEVPRSGNREAVLKAIEDFLDTVHQSNCDCLIFCTSRQQGYQQELDPKRWSHWMLEPLESDDALRLAQRVSTVLIAEDARREEILATLQEASEDETTAPLMVSPLQVMLLFQLVSTHNNIPRDRWTLFERHYETLRDREVAKSGALGTMIRDYRSQIDDIHRDAGYLLHLRAERAGAADAFITEDEFVALIKQQLVKDGFAEEAATLAPEIAYLATNRLVFLRSQVAGQIAFDVRSLQEFMAAARITKSPESLIQNRLREIAGRAHWLHVFKIACSKIYGSNTHEAIREPVVALLDSLDAGDRCSDDRLLRTGARIALQLLLDGAARAVPVYRRKLVVRALQLLGTRNLVAFWQLAQAIDFRDRTHLEPQLLEWLSSGDPAARFQTMQLLAYASRIIPAGGNEWVRDLLLAHWPDDPKAVLSLFGSVKILPVDPQLAAGLRTAQWYSSPAEVQRWIMQLRAGDDDEDLPEGVLILRNLSRPTQVALKTLDDLQSDLFLRFRGIANAERDIDEPEDQSHQGWAVLLAAQRFDRSPTSENAALVLETVGSGGVQDAKVLALSWPLRGLLDEVDDKGLDPVVAALRAGTLGGLEAWVAAEERWLSQGLTLGDFVNSSRDGMAVDWHTTGAPHILGPRMMEQGADASDTLVALATAVPGKLWPLRILFHYVTRHSKGEKAALRAFLKTFSPSHKFEAEFVWRTYASVLSAEIGRRASKPLLERLLHALQSPHQGSWAIDEARQQLIEAYTEDETKRFILVALASLFRGSRKEPGMSLPPSAYDFQPGDTPAVKAAIAILRLIADRDDAADADAIQAVCDAPPSTFGSLLTNLVRGRSGELGIEFAAKTCREAMMRLPQRRLDTSYDHLASLTEARLVDFGNRDRSEELELPFGLAVGSEAD